MSFICFYCSKNFKQKVSLKEHIIKRICFIKKEHRCWCGKECISPAALKVHKSKFHSCRVKYETVSLSFANFSGKNTVIYHKTNLVIFVMNRKFCAQSFLRGKKPLKKKLYQNSSKYVAFRP